MTMRDLFIIKNKITRKIGKNSHFKKVLYNTVPALSVLFFVFTIVYWNNQNYGLALSYNGKEIATIQGEETYEEVSKIIKQHSFDKDLHCPEYKLTVISTSTYSSAFDVKNKIMAESDTQISEAYGIYSDSTFVAAMESEQDINEIFNLLKEQSRMGDENSQINFLENIEVIKGLYSSKDLCDRDAVINILKNGTTSKIEYVVKENETLESIACDFNIDVNVLRNINDIDDLEHQVSPGDKLSIEVSEIFVHIETTKIEESLIQIPFEVIQEPDASHFEGWQHVDIKGKNGVESTINKIRYVNGVEESREEITKGVVESPINERVLIGIKKAVVNKQTFGHDPDNQGYKDKKMREGKLLWPVPYTHNISSDYGPREDGFHAGIDIASNGIHGQDIVASGDGIVEFAGSGRGYGNYVKILHSDGKTSTLYAHCKNVFVTQGQKVSAGQRIASVGTSGKSTGYHTHFEVAVNGDKKNPRDFV